MGWEKGVTPDKDTTKFSKFSRFLSAQCWHVRKLFLTTRRTTKIRNAFANNMSTDKKLSKAQICKIIQSGGSFWV